MKQFLPTKIVNAFWINSIFRVVWYISLCMNIMLFLDVVLHAGLINWPHSWVVLPVAVVSFFAYRWTDIVIMEYINSGQYDKDRREAERDERS